MSIQNILKINCDIDSPIKIPIAFYLLLLSILPLIKLPYIDIIFVIIFSLMGLIGTALLWKIEYIESSIYEAIKKEIKKPSLLKKEFLIKKVNRMMKVGLENIKLLFFLALFLIIISLLGLTIELILI